MARIIAIIALIAASLTMAAPAQAEPGNQEPCVTLGEYEQIRFGDSIARVTEIFDSEGTIVYQDRDIHRQSRSYTPCNNDVQWIVIEYHWRDVIKKWWAN